MAMRVVLILIALWGFVGVPALCEGGLLVDCCDEACPGQEDEGQECECSICLEVCEAVALVTDDSTTVDFTVAVIQHDDPLNVFCADKSSYSPEPGGVSLKIPFHDSDRPLLI